MFPLDPDAEAMRRTGLAAIEHAVAHLAGQRGLRVARRYGAAELRALVDEPLPEEGAGLEACLQRFFADLLPHCTQVNHPRFFAYVPGPGSWAGAIGELAAAVANLFVGTWLGGAAMVQLELTAIGWLRQALDLPAGFSGTITSGGSLANLSALAAALAAAPARREHAVVYASTETHYSMAKAARVLGVAENRIRLLPVRADQTLDPAALAEAIAADRAAGLWPAFVCANAGTTSTGAIDDLARLGEVSRAAGAWFHVDAAYGGAFALLPDGRAQFAGWQHADSITLDPHKGLYVPFECGCLLTPRTDALHAAFAPGEADYLQDVPPDEVNFFARGPELTRGARALKLWFVLRACGLAQIRAAIARDVAHARLAHDLLAADPDFEIVTPPRLSVFTFRRRGSEADNRRLLEAILADGSTMLSSSRVDGRYVLRFCALNPRTTGDDVRTAVATVQRLVHA
ncbi:MAG TPA: aminotransferase class V-fold PLP-dependent enzyme [Planctomycetota bacterium]|nr:aminotransferase class V-fold PLP-dependent enzyme [Planctomycetota bacterium]